jgi:S-adenosylmethionine decarboxylase
MFDCYGSNANLLEDVLYINKIMNEIPYILGLSTISPAALIPYYYGKIKADDGLSSYVLLDGGHLTIHTFPERKCYFLDLYSPKEVDEKVLEDYLFEYLHYRKELSIITSRDRLIDVNDKVVYNEKEDFGPHVILKIRANKKVGLELIYDFLENLVLKVGMTPIIRAQVVKSKIVNPRYESGIIIIAESHISVHNDIETGLIYSDIFSCMPFDYSGLKEIFRELGEVLSFEVCARGTKHYPKLADLSPEIFREASRKWKMNIYN